MHPSHNYSGLEKTLTEDVNSLQSYFFNWRLKLSVSSCFHLSNRQANTNLTIQCGDKVLPLEKQPKYLGVTLDRTLTFKCHLTQTAAEVQAHNNLIRRLAGTTWGANYNTLKVSATALVFFCCEILCSSVVQQCAHALGWQSLEWKHPYSQWMYPIYSCEVAPSSAWNLATWLAKGNDLPCSPPSSNGWWWTTSYITGLTLITLYSLHLF